VVGRCHPPPPAGEGAGMARGHAAAPATTMGPSSPATLPRVQLGRRALLAGLVVPVLAWLLYSPWQSPSSPDDELPMEAIQAFIFFSLLIAAMLGCVATLYLKTVKEECSSAKAESEQVSQPATPHQACHGASGTPSRTVGTPTRRRRSKKLKLDSDDKPQQPGRCGDDSSAGSTCSPQLQPQGSTPSSPKGKRAESSDYDVPELPRARKPHAGSAGRRGGLPVLLHVYDVSLDVGIRQLNSLLAHRLSPVKFGGIFHAGIEVAGREYSFGYCVNGSGIGTSTPREHPMHHYRETHHLPRTMLDEEGVQKLIKELSPAYQGTSYHVIRRNCCTFANEFSQKLGVGGIPAWVSRLADIGDQVLLASEGLGEKVNRIHLSHGPFETFKGQFESLQTAAAIVN